MDKKLIECRFKKALEESCRLSEPSTNQYITVIYKLCTCSYCNEVKE